MARVRNGNAKWISLLSDAESAALARVAAHLRPTKMNTAGDSSSDAFWAKGALKALNTIHSRAAQVPLSKAFATNFPRQLSVNSLIFLMYEVERAYECFPRVAISQSERRRKAKAISSAARIIAEELDHPATRSDMRISHRELRERDSRESWPWVSIRSESFLLVAELAEGMAKLPKVVSQPNSPTAHRLYFIRQLTDHCTASYRRPMRSLVLALAALYFDVSDISTNDLAKLAPVNERPIRRRFSSPR